MQRRIRFLIVPIFLLLLVPAFAQDPSLLTPNSIFNYSTQSLGPVQWQADGSGYLALEPSPSKKDFVDIVRYDVNTGTRRSEEHTSELQSQFHLVCRLLLEKKK